MNTQETQQLLQDILIELKKLTRDIQPPVLKCTKNLTGKEREKWYQTVLYAPEMSYQECIDRSAKVWKGKKQNAKTLQATYTGVSPEEAERLARRETYWMSKMDLAYFEDGFFIPEELDD